MVDYNLHNYFVPEYKYCMATEHYNNLGYSMVFVYSLIFTHYSRNLHDLRLARTNIIMMLDAY